KIVIAAGSEPVAPPVPGRELAIISDDVLFLPRFPESLVLVGGGVIGLEMAGAFSDLGSRVTVIVRETEILPALDGDVSAYIRKILEGRGVSFHLGATLERLSGERGAARSGEACRSWITRASPRRSLRRRMSRASGSRMPRRCAAASSATSPVTTWRARRTEGRRARTAAS